MQIPLFFAPNRHLVFQESQKCQQNRGLFVLLHRQPRKKDEIRRRVVRQQFRLKRTKGWDIEMLLAVLGDIHGNLSAFNRALEIIDDLGIELVFNTGDLVAGSPYPNEVIEIVRERRIPSVQGLFDRWVGLFQRKGTHFRDKLDETQIALIEDSHRQLRLDYVEFLRNLPRHYRCTAENIDIFLCHGSPESPADGIPPDASENRLLRARETANAQLILLGKTHQPFVRNLADTWFVNPGSLGIPVSGNSTGTFALVNTDAEPWEIEFRKIKVA